jgi:hypothetical protein
MMYSIISIIDLSYFMNLLYKNDMEDLVLVILNFYITFIKQLTGVYILIEIPKFFIIFLHDIISNSFFK